MTTENEIKPSRKPYSTPRIERIRLTADEAVLGNCKAVAGLFNGWQNDNCYWVIECLNVGS